MKETNDRRLEALRLSVKLNVNFCRSHADFFDDWGKVYSYNQEAADAYRIAADNLRFIAEQLDDALQLSHYE